MYLCVRVRVCVRKTFKRNEKEIKEIRTRKSKEKRSKKKERVKKRRENIKSFIQINR